MSENEQAGEKTEQPTEKRLRDAREQGNIPRSRELANVAVLGCAVLALKATAGSIGATSMDWMRGALTIDASMLGTQDRLLPHAAGLFGRLLLAMTPLFVAVADATEEAILNSMFRATTVSGHQGTVPALPLELVLPMLRQSNVQTPATP